MTTYIVSVKTDDSFASAKVVDPMNVAALLSTVPEENSAIIVEKSGDLEAFSTPRLTCVYNHLAKANLKKFKTKTVAMDRVWAELQKLETPVKRRPRNTGVDPDAKIKSLVTGNPKRPGSKSHMRYAVFRDGMTIAEYVAAGGTLADVRWNVAHGIWKVS